MEIHTESLTTAFKHWQNLALGAVLLAFSTFLAVSAKSLVNSTVTELQGWIVLVIAGYAFVAALYLAVSPLSEHGPLAESFPGVINHAKSFLVGAIFYAIGYFMLNIVILPSDELTQVLSLILGGGLFLVAAVIAVAGAFIRPKK